MSKYFSMIRMRLFTLIFIELVLLLFFHTFQKDYLFIVQYTIIVINSLLIFWLFYASLRTHKTRVLEVAQVLGNDAQDAFDFGKINIVTYDSKGNIDWVSGGFSEEIIGEPYTEIFPELSKIKSDPKQEVHLVYDEKDYLVSTMNNQNILYFKEESEFYLLYEENKNNQVVLGIANLDNYSETTQYEEENKIALIDSNIRQAVVRWANEHEMYVRRLKSDSYLLLLNEKSFEKVQQERFSILQTVRNQSRQLDTNITLSLAFARGSRNFQILEEMSNKALEVAQSRGGDQAVINTQGQQLRYYGGSSEAVEKRSKVRVRVMAQEIGRMISQSSNILIVGHKMMDFDSYGGCLALSAIAQSYQKDVYIVIEEGDIDASLLSAIEKNGDNLAKYHHFIHRSHVDNIINDGSLLIMVDHHNLSQTQFEDLPNLVKRVIIIDHHRRSGEFGFEPILAYIEPSASSTCELIVEFLPYQKNSVHIPAIVATLMYTGILVDTNRFRNRCGSRTFEAAAELRKYGADLDEAEDMLRVHYDNFATKNKIMSKATRFMDDIVIVPYKEEEVSRTMMSQVADEILEIRDIEASFVVAYVTEDRVAISARSKGDINVQIIMEKMGGGGHFAGAAVQLRGVTINEAVEQLKEKIKEAREELGV